MNGLVAMLSELVDLEREQQAAKQDEDAQLLNRMMLYKWCLR